MGEHEYPGGDYAIVELFGHTTLVGRITEVERFGAKMLAIEPLFKDAFLGVVYHGGAAIYRLTPCAAKIAFARQATDSWELPIPVRAIIPELQLPAPKPSDDDPDFAEVGEHPSDLPELVRIKHAARAVVDERYRPGSDWEALSDTIDTLADLVGGGEIRPMPAPEDKLMPNDRGENFAPIDDDDEFIF